MLLKSVLKDDNVISFSNYSRPQLVYNKDHQAIGYLYGGTIYTEQSPLPEIEQLEDVL